MIGQRPSIRLRRPREGTVREATGSRFVATCFNYKTCAAEPVFRRVFAFANPDPGNPARGHRTFRYPVNNEFQDDGSFTTKEKDEGWQAGAGLSEAKKAPGFGKCTPTLATLNPGCDEARNPPRQVFRLGVPTSAAVPLFAAEALSLFRLTNLA